MTWRWLTLAVLAAACKKPSNPGDKGHTDPGDIDTGDGDDTGVETCTAQVLEFSPENGDTGVYYRDALGVIFDKQATDYATFTLEDAASTSLGVQATWDASGLNATVTPVHPLDSNTTYKLTVSVCDTIAATQFETSKYGTPMTVATSDLIGLTYHFDLSEANYTQPPNVGSILATYLGEPLLIGVVDADDTQITILGAQGKVDDVTGDVAQDKGYTTWDFGSADFSGAPFFSAGTDSIVIEYDGTEIPVYDFYLEGSFESDAATIGGGMARGLGDTRNLGELIGLGSDPGAVCEFVAGVGLECETCPDGNDYCLTIEGYFEPSPLVPGLVLDPVAR